MPAVTAREGGVGMKRTRGARKPGARTARRSGSSKRKTSGMWKALLGAFLVGAVFGVFEAEYPWRGKDILVNAGIVIGYGVGVAVLVAIVLALTAARQRAAALIWRKHA
jgi:hypothetical protein